MQIKHAHVLSGENAFEYQELLETREPLSSPPGEMSTLKTYYRQPAYVFKPTSGGGEKNV